MNLISVKRNGTSFFQFPNLSRFSDIRHGIFTRKKTATAKRLTKALIQATVLVMTAGMLS